MTTDDEPAIKRRPREPEPPGPRQRWLHRAVVTLDELKQVEQILRDYVGASPAPEYEHSTDRRRVEIKAGTAILPKASLARELKPAELAELRIIGVTNSGEMTGVYFGKGGNVLLAWDSSSEESIAAAELIETVLMQNPKRFSQATLGNFALAISAVPLTVVVISLWLRVNQWIPGWVLGTIFLVLLPVEALLFWLAARIRKITNRPTIRNRSNQEIEDARSIPRGQLIAYALAVVGILVGLGSWLTR